MFSVLNIARSSCRSQLLRTLQSNNSCFYGKYPLVIATDCSMTPWSLQKSGTVSVHSAANEHAEHNHSRLWKAERFLSAGLLGLLPAAIAFPNPALDYALGLALTAHVHWGIEAVVVDYVRPSVVGPTISKMAVASIYGLSMLTLGGIFYFNYNDVGIGQAIRMLWKL